MDYQRIYDQIIDRARKESRQKVEGGIYYESHHIVPRCMGGEGKASQWKTHPNIVLLTGREHFLVHRVLVKIYPENSKLIFAFWGMCNQKSKGQEKRYIPSSRAYQEAKKLFSESNSESQKAFSQTEEGKVANAKNSTTLRAFFQTEEGRAVRIAQVVNTDYVARALKQIKPILQFSKDGTFIKEWPSIKEAGESLEISRNDISTCCRGRLKTAGKFIWKYSKNN